MDVGTQVWLPLQEGVWWPAMVIDPHPQGLHPKPDECCIYCFGSNNMCVIESIQLSRYDTDVSKRQSDYPGLAEAIQLADNRLAGQSLKDSLHPNTTPIRLQSNPKEIGIEEAMNLLENAGGSEEKSGSKKTRRKSSMRKMLNTKYIADKSEHSVRRDTDSGSGYSSDGSTSSESDTKHSRDINIKKQSDLKLPSEHHVLHLKQQIESLPEVDEMRNILLHVSSLDMNFDLIKDTKIGITVANIMTISKYQKLHIFCEGILVHWIGLLPEDILLELNDPASSYISPNDSTKSQESTRNWHDAMQSTFEEFMPKDTAKIVEEILCEKFGDGTPARFRKLVHALRTHSTLQEQITDGTISAVDFVMLSNDKLVRMDNVRADEHVQYHTADVASGLTTEMFVCPECGHKKCSYYEQQVRSGDEPQTIFLTCLACKHSWCVNN